jgi:T5orf172 domain
MDVLGSSPQTKAPWLHLMHVPDANLVKIGHTIRNPRLRASEATSKTGYRHEVVWARRVEGAPRIEKHLQRALARFRVYGFKGYEYFGLGTRERGTWIDGRVL